MSRPIFLTSRFRSIVRAQPLPVRKKIGAAIHALQDALGQPHRHSGIGVRKLVHNYYELRVGLDLRLIFRVDSVAIHFVFAGNHDAVHTFVKTVK